MIVIACAVLALSLAAQDPHPLERFRSRIGDVPAEKSDALVRKCKDLMVRCIDGALKNPAEPDLALVRRIDRDLQDLLHDDAFLKDPRRTGLVELWESMRRAINPLESLRSSIEGVPTDSNNPEVDANVKVTRKLFIGLIERLFRDPGAPDWKAIAAAREEWKKLEEEIGNDPRVYDLGSLWGVIEEKTAAMLKNETARYEDARLLERLRRDLDAKSVRKIERLLAECDYALSVLPKEKSGAFTELRGEASRILAAARTLDKERERMKSAVEANWAEAQKAAERGRKNPAGTDDEALRRHEDWEAAATKCRLILRQGRSSIQAFPQLGEENADLLKKVEALEAESARETRALEERAGSIARARHGGWVKSLAGDKKSLFASKGAPGWRSRGDGEWRYVVYEGGKKRSTTVTFDGDKISATENQVEED